MKVFLGVDIGTHESKGTLVDETGKILAYAAAPHRMIVPRPGWAEHRAEEDWWGDFNAVTRELLAKSKINPGAIACVATSAIGPCMLPVDAHGKPLINAVLYGVDTRAEEEIEILNTAIGPERIMAKCGNALTSQSVGPKILWFKRNHPGLLEKTAKILTSTSFLVHRLTGEYVIDHYSAANFSPLYDVETLDWTLELSDEIIDIERLPRLLWSTDIAGHITPQAARETGLAEGTPVTAGTIDAAAEAVSVGARHNGDLMMMYGSSIFIIQVTGDRRVNDPRLWYAPWLREGTHASMAGLATSGTLTHWFREYFARDLPKDGAFAALAEEAAQSTAGANGLLFLPYFSGVRTPIHDSKAKGAIFGLNLTHSRGDVYRAIIEGIAMGTAHVIETYRDINQAPQRILAVGGGTKNRLWLQATSDFSDLSQIVAEKTMGASYGNAFLAACSVGMAKPEDIDDWNPVKEVIPAERTPVHARHYELFRKLYEESRAVAHAL